MVCGVTSVSLIPPPIGQKSMPTYGQVRLMLLSTPVIVYNRAAMFSL